MTSYLSVTKAIITWTAWMKMMIVSNVL